MMSGFTDIHAHLAYGMDDGAQSQADMEAMLDAAHADGVAFLFATPHVTPGIWPFNEEAYLRHLAHAQSYCQRKGYGITLFEGAEIMYTPALRQCALEKRVPTLGNSRNVLLEFTPRISYDELQDAVALLGRCGYGVILAHVERYRCLCAGRNAERLKETHDVRYQMNASSIVERQGFLRRRVIWRWLQEGLIDHVATDSHDCHRRPTNMSRAYQVLCDRVGQAYADRLTGIGGP